MFGKLGRAITGLMLTREAKEAMEQHAAEKRYIEALQSQVARERVLSQVREQSRDFVTSDRADLIRNAMQVRKAKQTVLADLSDEERAKLVALAMKALLNEGRE